MWPLPWYIGPHCTVPPGPIPPPSRHWTTLGQASPVRRSQHDICWPQPWPLDMGLHIKPQATGPLLVTSGGHHWRPLQTCSLEDPLPSVLTSSGEGCTVGASRLHASYWNAFLLELLLVFIDHCIRSILWGSSAKSMRYVPFQQVTIYNRNTKKKWQKVAQPCRYFNSCHQFSMNIANNRFLGILLTQHEKKKTREDFQGLNIVLQQSSLSLFVEFKLCDLFSK